MSTTQVAQRKNRVVEAGFAAAWYRKPVTHAPRRTIPGDAAAHVLALSCRHVPEEHARWTLRMLADTLVELDIIDSVSPETSRRP